MDTFAGKTREPWFVAADVRRSLGLIDHGHVYDACSPDETCRASSDTVRALNTDKGRQAQGVALKTARLVSESGLYKLIMRSDKPTAKPFQEWVTREVLPSIRKTGGYQLGPGETMPIPTSMAEAFRQHAATLIRPAEEQEAHAQTKAETETAAQGKAAPPRITAMRFAMRSPRGVRR
jgi:prophage antirepressor-like protein